MNEQISDWPPITAHLRSDGSLELVVAGMSYHFQDSPGASAQRAALEHVHALARTHARPLRVKTTAAGESTGSLIVALDATFWAEDDPTTTWPLDALTAAAAAETSAVQDDVATRLFTLGAATPAPSRTKTSRRPSTVLIGVGAAVAIMATSMVAAAAMRDQDATAPVASPVATAVASPPATTATATPAPPQLAARAGKPARRTATLRITSNGAAQNVRVTITRGGQTVTRSVVVSSARPAKLTLRLKPGRYRWTVTPAAGTPRTGGLRVLAPKPKKKVTQPRKGRDTAPAPAPAPRPTPAPAPEPKPKKTTTPKKDGPKGDSPAGPIGD